jgi:type I restriction enzyme S subunit
MIKSLASIVRKGVPTTFFANRNVEHFSLPAFDAGALPAIEAGDAIKSGKNLLEGATVLVSKLNPRIPRVWMAVPSGTLPAVTSTEFIGLTPVRDDSVEVLWALCNAPGFSSQLGERVKGTTGSHQRVAPEDVLTVEIPDPRLLDESAKTTITLAVRLAGTLRRESSRLTNLRNALLPKLLSGEIRVGDAEAVVGDAV